MKDKYYVELFVLKNIILYGYAVTTDIPESDLRNARIKVKNKININKYTYTLKKSDFQEFKEKLQSETIQLYKDTIEAGLKEGINILKINHNSAHMYDEVIYRLSYKTILWNLNKMGLLNKINSIFGNDESVLNMDIINSALKEEIGFELNKNIEKLGNFEVYDLIEDEAFVRAESDKNIMGEKTAKAEKSEISKAKEESLKIQDFINLESTVKECASEKENNEESEKLKFKAEALERSEDFNISRLNDNDDFKDEQEIIKLYNSIKLSSSKTIKDFEEEYTKSRLEIFKDIVRDNKKEICGFFIEECRKNNLESFKALSLLMHNSTDIKDEIINNFHTYDLPLEHVENYIQIILSNDNTSERNKIFLSLREKLERLCNNNPITVFDFNEVKKVFNKPAKPESVINKYAFCFAEVLCKYGPERLLKLIIDIKAPLVYTEFILYLKLNWNREIFMQLLKCRATSFKELGFYYAYRNIKNKTEKIRLVNEISSIMDKVDRNEFLAFILTMISDEYSKEETEFKDYIVEELINNLDENINIKRLLILLHCNDNCNTIYNLYNIRKKLNFNKLRMDINKEIISLIEEQYCNKSDSVFDVDEISRILSIGADSRILLKNNNLTIGDLKKNLIKNNYNILGNPYLKDINYKRWNEAAVKFIINFIYKSYLINKYEGEDKVNLINSIIDELSTAMIGLSQIENESSIDGVRLIVSILDQWIKSGYIDEDKKNKIYSMSSCRI